MKKYLISAVLSTQLMFGTGIPVVDALANAQDLTQNIKEIGEWAEEANRWMETATHYKSQLTAYENELMSKTGIRDAVSFVKDLDRLKQYAQGYGEDYLDLGTDLLNKNSRVGNMTRSLFNKYNIFDRCKNEIYKQWEKDACKNKLAREVQQIATVQETKEMVDKSTKNLEELGQKVTKSADIKESQDIANAINIEIAQMEIVKMKMDMLKTQNEAAKKVDEEQREQQIASTKNVAPDLSGFDFKIQPKDR